jgi:hypothetical protein
VRASKVETGKLCDELLLMVVHLSLVAVLAEGDYVQYRIEAS